MPSAQMGSKYKVTKKLYEGGKTVIYRGEDIERDCSVILKVLKAESATPRDLARLNHAYEVTRHLDCEGVVHPHGLEVHHGQLALVFEDFGHGSLRQVLMSQPVEVGVALDIAVQLAGTVAQLHQRGLIHKDLKPDNIIIDADTGQVKITDFGSSVLLAQETLPAVRSGPLEGTLAYMSPEQTGRTSHGIDHRTDFYSLGVTLYELLSGRLPFPTTDLIELVHSHLAKRPMPPHELNPDIPATVSEIVMKLLAKTPEARYQSALGLQADLHACLRQWRATGGVDPFPLGQHDVSAKFQIPPKLYGRQPELALLMAAFEQVGKGGKRMLLVSGDSGAGKSTLIHDIHQPLARQPGCFIAGKFEQYHQNIPYDGIAQAFRDLTRQLLTEDESRLAGWREKLPAAVGPNGQVILDVIPEMELVLGRQPAAPELPPVEAQNRFHLVFGNVARSLAQLDHPLVLFLDDLQWADASSLRLIQWLMADPRLHYFLLIGTYRETEVTQAHPLAVTLNQMEQAGVSLDRLALKPLERADLTQLVADTLRCQLEQAEPLAALVFNKTGGNPFFAREFLKSLHQDQWLVFDHGRGCWQWDLARLQALDVTENVLEFMAGKIQKLPPPTQRALQLAACLGNRFEVDLLATVAEQSTTATLSDLWPAVVEGSVLPVNHAGGSSPVPDVAASYKFLHDRVQQAAYSLIPDEQKSAGHLSVGRLMRHQLSPAEQEERLFEILNHLNLGIDLITDQAERDDLAHLNLLAGRRARASAAYDLALGYFTAGMRSLTPGSWMRQYERALALHVEAAEAAYLAGDVERMEQLVDVVERRAISLLDQVKVYEVKLHARVAQNRLPEATRTALDVLALLGVKLPEKPGPWRLRTEALKTKLALAGKRVEDLLALPEMTDPYKLAAMRILSASSIASYYTLPTLYQLYSFKRIQLSVQHGHAPTSAQAISGYAFVLAGAGQDIEAGERFGQLALKLAERFNSKEHTVRAALAVYVIQHWRQHLRDCLTPLLDIYQQALEVGVLQHAALAANVYCYSAFGIGKELAALEREIASYDTVLKHLKQETFRVHNEMLRQVVVNLMDPPQDPCHLFGPFYDEREMLPRHQQVHSHYALCYLHLNKLMLCYFWGRYADAVANATVAEQYVKGISGLMHLPVLHFYDSLARLATYSDAPPPDQKRILRKVAANQKKMKRWARFAPMNYQHKVHLVEAERARVLGHAVQAMDEYDRAIEGARDHDFIQEEALANELAARSYLARGQEKIARSYLLDARYGYLRWGALAKVRQLDEQYPELRSGMVTTGKSSAEATASASSGASSSSDGGAGVLDLLTVMKASQAISSEIVPEQLLKRVMGIVLENAGAQKGFLILEREGRWVIEAAGDIEKDEAVVLPSCPVDSSPDLPLSIVQYVARTREHVVLHEATAEGLFSTDAYLLGRRPKSVLCAPIIHQGRLLGMVYLENNLVTGAFTPDRLEVLRLLCAQAAISMDHAQLVALQQELNIARRIQASILPQTFPPFPERTEFEIYAQMVPAKEVGGDFYDFFMIDEARLGFVIGDVSGKGVPAALFMAVSRTLLKSTALTGHAPHQCLEQVNRLLRAENDSQMFVSLFYGILDTRTGEVTYSIGGHDPAYWLRPQRPIERVAGTGGIVLGLTEEVPYESQRVVLRPGEALFLYTDGVTDATDGEGRQFSHHRLEACLERVRWSSVTEMIPEVVRAAKDFGGGTQTDDITVLAVRYLGTG